MGDVIFEFENVGTQFTDSCEPVGYPCHATHYPMPYNCSWYFQCVDKKIFLRPCSKGTGFSNATGTCVDDFYSDCSCPDYSSTTTKLMTTQPDGNTEDTNNQIDKSGMNKAGLIAGCLVAVIAVLVICAVVFILLKRKYTEKEKSQPGQFTNPAYNEDRTSYISVIESQLHPPGKSTAGPANNPPEVPGRNTENLQGPNPYDNKF